jgi:hypothetical protein
VLARHSAADNSEDVEVVGDYHSQGYAHLKEFFPLEVDFTLG